MSCKLIVFLKNPESGKVKTRIAKTCGNSEALQIYIRLLKHTLDIAESSKLNVLLSFSEKVDEHDMFNEYGFQKTIQTGDDLGERMHNAFINSLHSEHGKTIIIGSDCLQLEAKHLREACEALNHNDAVFGPAIDGGYYLIGLNSPQEKLFLAKSWSHQNVLSEALYAAKEQGLNVHLLEPLSDIDTYDDWLDNKHIVGL